MNATYAATVAPWTAEDTAAAIAEGWCISNDSEDYTQLQRIDEPEDGSAPKFDGDRDALWHVAAQAARGSALHVRAMAYLATTHKENAK